MNFKFITSFHAFKGSIITLAGLDGQLFLSFFFNVMPSNCVSCSHFKTNAVTMHFTNETN